MGRTAGKACLQRGQYLWWSVWLELGGTGQQGLEAWVGQGFHPEHTVVMGCEVTQERGPVLFTFKSSEPLWEPRTR